jgi:hypothetical protein
MTIEALLAKVRRQTKAQVKLCELRGEKLPRVSRLPMDWRFFRIVLRDQNLPTLREKLQFMWVMHRGKWAISVSLHLGIN